MHRKIEDEVYGRVDNFVDGARSARRFELKLPLEIFRRGRDRVSYTGQTENISSGGVLFTVNTDLEIGEPIEYDITLVGGWYDANVVLRCWGRVLRREICAGSRAFATNIIRHELIRVGKEEYSQLAAVN